MDYLPGEDHTIDKPEQYTFWKDYQADFWPGPQFGWVTSHPITLEKKLTPRQVRSTESHLKDFQSMLVETLGFVLAWPEYARITPR